jgi:dienelactone hydrolase
MKTLSYCFFSIMLAACGFSQEAAAQTPRPKLSWEKVWIPAKYGSSGSAGEDIRLEAHIVKPEGNGPFPVAIISHGSTGKGKWPVRLTMRADFAASEFLKHRFVVVSPMRRGRGESGGTYDEPYDCTESAFAAGLQRAIEDTDHVIEYVKKLPYVDSSRIILSGQSRGSILSVVYASRKPGLARGVVNFAGGWSTDRCSSQAGGFNEKMFREAGAASKIPMLFLYSENDSYFSASSMAGFGSAFENAGGTVVMRLYPPVGNEGHSLFAFPEVWRADFQQYLEKLGFPKL